MKTITLLALLALSGCATLSPEARVTEVAWQTLNVIDIGQTVTISREPAHWHETNPGLCALASNHPATGKVYAIMIGDALLHYAVTALLDDKDTGRGPWHVANIAWQFVTLGEKGYNVAHNFDVGLKPWSGRSDLVRQ
jgi:hypothetical protein